MSGQGQTEDSLPWTAFLKLRQMDDQFLTSCGTKELISVRTWSSDVRIYLSEHSRIFIWVRAGIQIYLEDILDARYLGVFIFIF